MTAQENEKREHIALSEHYYKSRKQLMIFSGLFFIYEFIGVKVPVKPFPNSDVELLSPQATPIALIILVIYFIYRTILGWHQSTTDSRRFKVSRLDYYPSLIISILPILLFTFQLIYKMQLVDLIERNIVFIYSTWFGAFIALFTFWFFSRYIGIFRGPFYKIRDKRFFKIADIFFIVGFVFANYLVYLLLDKLLILYSLLGFITVHFLLLSFYMTINFSRRNK